MPDQNESLRELQTTLIRQVNRLSDSLEDVTDVEKAEAISGEMTEISHRVAIIGGLLFRKQADELDEKVAAVKKATRSVNAAIANFRDLQAFLGAFSEFLALVDEAIDLGKVL